MVLAPVSYEPIRPVRLISGLGTPAMLRVGEAATQTFKKGAPLVLSSGYLQECAFGGAETVYGVSDADGSNLTASGTAEMLDHGPAQNMTSSAVIPVGAWPNDGKIGAFLANGQTVFSIALKAGQVYTAAMLGTVYGITKDTPSGYWYLDNTDTTGDNAVATVVGYDETCPNTVAGGCRVFFQFKASLRAF